MIIIPENEWKPTEEIRENIVQDICNAFLNGTSGAIFRPYNTSIYRRRTNGLVYYKDGKPQGFGCKPLFDGDTIVKFTSKELNAAIKCLVKAGWHLFFADNCGWPCIKCSKYNYMDGGREIYEWEEFFDKD